MDEDSSENSEPPENDMDDSIRDVKKRKPNSSSNSTTTATTMPGAHEILEAIIMKKEAELDNAKNDEKQENCSSASIFNSNNSVTMDVEQCLSNLLEKTTENADVTQYNRNHRNHVINRDNGSLVADNGKEDNGQSMNDEMMNSQDSDEFADVQLLKIGQLLDRDLSGDSFATIESMSQTFHTSRSSRDTANDEEINEDAAAAEQESTENRDANMQGLGDLDEEDCGDFPDEILAGRHNWRSFVEIQKREYGTSNRCAADWFRYRATGSLHIVQRLELMYKMEFHQGCVNCLHFNSDGTRLASGSDDLKVCIWDWTMKRPMLNFNTGHRGNVFNAKFMPLSGDCHIVTCGRDGQVRLAELSVRDVCKNTRKLAQHKGAAHKLSLQHDSPHVFLTCGEDAVVYEIDLRDPAPNKILVVKEPTKKNRPVPLYSIHVNPVNSNYFAVCGRDNFCRMYDQRRLGGTGSPAGSETSSSYMPVKQFSPDHLIHCDANSKNYHNANVTCLVFNHDGTELLASYNDDDIFLFDVNSTKDKDSDAVIHRYKGHRNNATVKGVNFYGPNSEFVVSGSDCGYIYFWDKQTEEIVQFLPGDEQGVINVLEPHPTAAVLATSGLDHDVKVWVPSNEEPKFDRKELRRLVKANTGCREEDRQNQDSGFDAHMLWVMISRMRRDGRRRRQREAGDQEQNEDADPLTMDSDNDNDSPALSDSDGDDNGASSVQCRAS